MDKEEEYRLNILQFLEECNRTRYGESYNFIREEIQRWSERTGKRVWSIRRPLREVAQEMVNYYPKPKNTGLHVACRVNRVHYLEWFLKNKKIPINSINDNGYTPLMVAIEHGANACVDFLLDLHVDVVVPVNVRTFENANATTIAARLNDVRVLRRMIAEYNFYELFAFGNEPLMVASAFGNYESLELLLNYVTEQNRSQIINIFHLGETPLMLNGVYHADEAKRMDCLRLLLKHGADPNVTHDFYDYTVLDYAIKQRRNREYFNVLVEHTNFNAMDFDVSYALLRNLLKAGKIDVIEAIFDKLIKVGAASVNENFFSVVQFVLKCIDEEEPIQSIKNSMLEYIFKDNHGPPIIKFEPVYRLRSMKHTCRLAIRNILSSTGRYTYLREVNTKKLELPVKLAKYVMYE